MHPEPPATTAEPTEPAERTRRSAIRPVPETVLVLVALASAVVVVAGLKSFSGTVGPAFLALVLVIVAHPVQTWLQRRRVPGWVGTVALVAVLYSLVLAVAAALGWSIVRLAETLPGYSSRFVELEGQATDLLGRVGVGRSQISDALASVDTSRVLGLAQSAVSQVGSGLSSLFFVLLLLFFLALDAAVFPKLLAQLTWTHEDLVRAVTGFASGTRRFILVSTVFGLVVAALDTGALVWLAVPLPLLWGLWAFLTNYIANVGFFLGLVPPTLLALLSEGPRTALLVVIVFTLLNTVIQGLVQPRVVGGFVGLSSTLTFLSVVFWGYVLGAFGALLAVPLSLLARAVLVDANPAAHWLVPLLAGNPRGKLPPPVEIGRSGPGGATVAPAGR